MWKYFRPGVAVWLVLFVACAERPPVHIADAGAGKKSVSIAELKALYSGGPLRITGELSVVCYVTANDRHGNFYHTLAVGDSTGGIRIKVASDRLWEDYWVGDCLTVYCSGLTLGAYGGTVSLGGDYGDGYENSPLAAEDFRRRTVKSGWLPEPPEPVIAEAGRLAPSMTSMLVRFENMLVAGEDAGKPWTEDGIAGERRFTDPSGDTLAVSTRPQADFAHVTVPPNRCALTGILDYFAGTYRLILREWEDILETGSEY